MSIHGPVQHGSAGGDGNRGPGCGGGFGRCCGKALVAAITGAGAVDRLHPVMVGLSGG